MPVIKKLTPAVLIAYEETEQIYDRELDKLTDKIANDTITPDERRYYDRVIRLRAENTASKIKFISDNTPKNAVDRLFNKLVAPLV